jgi:hypothetical protein
MLVSIILVSTIINFGLPSHARQRNLLLKRAQILSGTQYIKNVGFQNQTPVEIDLKLPLFAREAVDFSNFQIEILSQVLVEFRPLQTPFVKQNFAILQIGFMF